MLLSYSYTLKEREPRSVVKHNRRLDSRLVPDALERLAELLELEHLVDDALGLDLARIEIVDRLCCFSLGQLFCHYLGRGDWKRGFRWDARNMWTSEKEPMIRSSSPKILEGGQVTRAALA